MTLKIVGYKVYPKENSIVIWDSYSRRIESNNPKELWDFLYKPYKTTEAKELKIVWNLDEDMSYIFHLMSVPECKTLLNKSFKESEHIYYRHKKNLIIKGDIQINGYPYFSHIYGIDKFFPETEPEPKDALELVKKAYKIIDAANNIGISKPLTLNSPVAMYMSSMRNLKVFPNINCIPPHAVDILNYAKPCAQRAGWISNMRVGHFPSDKVFDYDVSSSYGFQLANIRNFEKAIYTKTKPSMESILRGDVTGFFEVLLTIYDKIKLHPFAYIDESGKPIYPVGTYKTFLTLEEIIFINHYKIGETKVLDGWYVQFLDGNKPMYKTINKMFDNRQLGSMENTLEKGNIVGLVGQMNSEYENDETSKIYNPMAAGWIYAQARLQVFKFILQNELIDDVISIATDGVMSYKSASKTPISTKPLMGSWRLNPPSPALVLSPGWILYADKHPHGINYETAVKMINEKPNSSIYRMQIDRPITLSEAVEMNDLSMVGKTTGHYSTIDLNMIRLEQDRIYHSFPSTGKQLLSGRIYDSEPLRI